MAATYQPLDTKPYVAHHPLFGYQYIPGTTIELPRPGGGSYHLKINLQGIRSDREYSFQKPQSVYRIIVCGDSMAAGQFINNSHRFSELLERRIPGLEVLNLALEGSGTDQQLLLYEHVGLKFEHDLVLVLPFLQNIRRNMVEAREGIDPKTGQKVYRPKPRYDLVEGKLALRNVPVPKEVSAEIIEKRGGTDVSGSRLHKIKALLNTLPSAAFFKKIFYGVIPWEPFPEYRDPESKEWRLMAAIIRRLRELAGHRPVVVVPTFYSSYVRFRMARNYLERYLSLTTAPGMHVIDLLPYFRCLGPDAVRCFQEPYDMHFSAYGHIVLAEALQNEMLRRGLFSPLIK
jgi:carbamoyltransferase